MKIRRHMQIRWARRVPLVLGGLAVAVAAGASLGFAEEPTPEKGDAKEKPAEVATEDGAEKTTDAPDVEVGPDVGQRAPGFTLKDIEGNERKLSDFRGKIVVLEWMNHGCPAVKKHYEAGNMQKLQKKATGKGVVWLSICSSAPGKQGHMDNEAWKKVTEEKGAAPTAVLPDPDGTVGKLYKAQRTPTMWVLDAKGIVAYTGALDSGARARSADDIAAATNYVMAAIEALQADETPEVTETRPYG